MSATQVQPNVFFQHVSDPQKLAKMSDFELSNLKLVTEKVGKDEINLKLDSVQRLDSGFDSCSETDSVYEDCPDSADIFPIIRHVQELNFDSGVSSVSSEEYETQTIEQMMDSVMKILDLFHANKFDEAMAKVNLRADKCVHHSQAKMYFRFFYAVLTLDPEMVDEAKKDMRAHLELLSSRRPERSLALKLSTFFFKENVDAYDEEELLVELDYAESLFFSAIFTFFGSGQTLVSLLRAAFKLNNANNIVNFCLKVLKEKKSWRCPIMEKCFRAGVLNGAGFSNMILSNLPNYILRVLAIAGLSGDKVLGKQYLDQASKIDGQPRYQLTSFIIMGINIYLHQILGIGEGDVDWAAKIGGNLLDLHPEGAFVKFLNARVFLLKSQPKRAIELYTDCLNLGSSWKQVDLFCYFDLIWAHALLADWDTAARYSLVLKNNCTWGGAINMHQFACFKIMKKYDADDLIVDDEILNAMKEISKLRKRYCGKTFPAEKFSVEKSIQYIKNNGQEAAEGHLPKSQSGISPLHVYELFYVWNVFSFLSSDGNLIKPILERLEREIKADHAFNYTLEERCTLIFLKGHCCRFLGKYHEAIECFNRIQENEDSLGRSFLIPHSRLELGYVYMTTGNITLAREWVAKAQAKSKYLMEAVIQIKAHGILRQLDEMAERQKQQQ